jgi:hypothetical protein
MGCNASKDHLIAPVSSETFEKAAKRKSAEVSHSHKPEIVSQESLAESVDNSQGSLEFQKEQIMIKKSTGKNRLKIINNSIFYRKNIKASPAEYRQGQSRCI